MRNFRSSRIRFLGAPIVSGVMIALSFPKWELSFLAWIALIPLLWAAGEATWRLRFIVGLLQGFIAYYISLAWITETMINYGGMNGLMSYGVLALLALYLGVYISLVVCSAFWVVERLALPLSLVFPLFWVAQEYLRGFMLTGFPWNLLGYSQYQWLELVQISDLTGPYGVGFLIALINVALYETFFLKLSNVRRLLTISGAVGLLALALVYGKQALRSEGQVAETVRVGYVQANIPQDEKWETVHREQILRKYVDHTRALVDGGEQPQLIVWPEAATPFYYRYGDGHRLSDGRTYKQAMRDALAGTRTWLLFGTPEADPDTDVHYNAACLIDHEGVLRGIYRKRHLVPFGEYVPLRRILFFVEKLAVLGGDFGEGAEATVFRLPGVPEFGAYICYETVFPELSRASVAAGAKALVNLTNDAWFGSSSGPYQHFSATVFRAVENHVPIVRVANTGISGLIDGYGRILARTELLTVSSGVYQVPITRSASRYTRHGDVFAVLCCLFVLGSLTALWAKSKRKESKP